MNTQDKDQSGAAVRGEAVALPATMFHNEGAVARCFYCSRYTLDPAALGTVRVPLCECGKQHGWSGSFKPPGADAVWSGSMGPATVPVAAPVSPRAADALDSQPTYTVNGEVMSPLEYIDYMHRQYAGERLRADQGWERYESANKDRNALRAAMVDSRASSAPVAPIAPDDQSVNTIMLTGHQLVAALDLIAPGLPRDPEELDNDLTFGVVQHKDDDGVVATGMCCWNDDTDGVLPLDEHPDDAAPQQEGSEARK